MSFFNQLALPLAAGGRVASDTANNDIHTDRLPLGADLAANHVWFAYFRLRGHNVARASRVWLYWEHTDGMTMPQVSVWHEQLKNA